MVKIAPDKSLPQTKNRGQRLTLTEGGTWLTYGELAEIRDIDRHSA
jgi:hypothetical protein